MRRTYNISDVFYDRIRGKKVCEELADVPEEDEGDRGIRDGRGRGGVGSGEDSDNEETRAAEASSTDHKRPTARDIGEEATSNDSD